MVLQLLNLLKVMGLLIVILMAAGVILGLIIVLITLIKEMIRRMG
jgi:hypothetical protein